MTDVMPPLVGIFVGGKAERMDGVPKGLLEAPDGSGPLVLRSAALARALGLEVVLVGAHPAYATLGLGVVPDARAACGPLGGLVALLTHASGRDVVALACDLPFVGPELLRALVSAPPAPIVAPRREGRWEPLAARYSARVLPLARSRLEESQLSLQGLATAAEAVELALDPDGYRQLEDWDTPEDVRRKP